VQVWSADTVRHKPTNKAKKQVLFTLLIEHEQSVFAPPQVVVHFLMEENEPKDHSSNAGMALQGE
jgi:hypothetical protein